MAPLHLLVPAILAQDSGGAAPNEPLLAFDFENNLTNSSSSGITISQTAGTTISYVSSSITGSNSMQTSSGVVLETSSISDLDGYGATVGDSITMLVWIEVVSGSQNSSYNSFTVYSDNSTGVGNYFFDNQGSGFDRVVWRNNADSAYVERATASAQGTSSWRNLLCNWERLNSTQVQARIWSNGVSVVDGAIDDAGGFLEPSINSYFEILNQTVTTMNYDSLMLWKDVVPVQADADYFYNSGSGRAFLDSFNRF